MPTFAGCSVAIRAIGLAEPLDDSGAYTVVGIPTADRHFDDVNDLSELPEPWAGAISAVLAGRRLVDGHQARTFVAAAKEETLRTRAATRPGSSMAAWKTGGPWGAVPSAGQSGHHTMAERAVPLLPLRFQKYIARELLDDERILMFIQRRSFTPGGTRISLRRRRLPEGVFVLTDRQVMFMADALDPDSTLVHWGYIAQVTAVERIAGATRRNEAGACALEVLLEAKGGHQVLAFPFPSEDATLLSDAVELLNQFVSSPSQRKVQRLYDAHPPASAEPPAWATEQARGGGLLAWAETREGARFMVDRHSVQTSRKDHPGAFASLEIAEVASLELTLALTGCRHAAFAPGHSPTVLSIAFDYPQASEFLAIFTALRQLLGQLHGNRCYETSETAAR
jgi:hypothetical protein